MRKAIALQPQAQNYMQLAEIQILRGNSGRRGGDRGDAEGQSLVDPSSRKATARQVVESYLISMWKACRDDQSLVIG